MSSSELLKMTDKQLFDEIPSHKKQDFVDFIKELNRREYLVRFAKSCTFETFQHLPNESLKFGSGFIVNGKSVPYFHPNRSFHDEIIWLNENLFYNPQATFEDKLINAAIIKFYGPSNTLKLISANTGKNFVDYKKFISSPKYLKKICVNLETAVKNKEKIYGTTELRTSLQTAARNYARDVGSPIDKIELISKADRKVRTCRSSDILFWFTKIGPDFVNFYKQTPNMEESFNFLNSFRGIGNYYGYHFSCNLARMPEVGNLIFQGSPGRINEDDEYVVPGVGAMAAINWFYEHRGHSINTKVGKKLINAIRKHQNSFFDLKKSDNSKFYMEKVSELGYFTNFGCEISCCQFGVYRRLREDKKLALRRAAAPISKEEVKMILTPKTLMQKLGLISEDKPIKKELEIKSPTLDFSSTSKEDLILNIVDQSGEACSHSLVAKLIEEKGYTQYKQEGSWKESWVIMRDLVEKGALVKDGKFYRRP